MEAGSNPSRGRRRLFVAGSLTVSIGVLLLCELALRTAGVGGRPPLFVDVPGMPGYRQANPAVIRRYVGPAVRLPVAIEPIPFLRDKPDDVFRIVVQGGSTAAGFPYGRWGGIAGMLGDRLEAELPDRRVELITTAMAAVDSNTLVDLVDEIIGIEPDAVLVYAGHNEYVGVLGVASALTPGPSGLRVPLALRQLGLYRAVEWLLATASGAYAHADDDPIPLFQRAAAASLVAHGTPAYRAGVEQFDRNLGALLGRYRAAGVPVYLGTLACNLRDLPPFVGGPSDDVDEARWRALLARARDERRAGALAAAARSLDTLLELDPEAADAWFERARLLEAEGEPVAARDAYRRARDLDRLRFRAPGVFNERIRARARSSGARLVDVEARFSAAAPGPVPGHELFLEHVHPNAEGYFLLADAFRDALAADAAIGSWPAGDSEARARRDMPITALDRVLARLDVETLTAGFPFRDPAQPVWQAVPDPELEQLARRLRAGEIDWLHAMEELLQRHRRAGETREAARVARIVAQAYPHDATPSRVAGLLLLEQGDPVRARRYLEQSLRADPDDPRTRAALARLRRRAGPATGEGGP